MKKVLLDTSFILNCVKKKIDFFEFFELEGFRILIPDKVLGELERLSIEGKKGVKVLAEFARKFLESEGYESIKIEGRYADSAIVNYLKENPRIYLATIDEALTKKIKNKIFIVRSKKKIEE